MSKGLGGKFISVGKPKKLAGGQILILPTVRRASIFITPGDDP